MPARSRTASSSRHNQRHRTRKDLLAAAARLLREGRTPDMQEVAREAMVSRATAYRYFPKIELLLVEAPLDGAAPDPRELFAADPSIDPTQRLDKAEAALHEMCYRNEAQLRVILSSSLDRNIKPASTAPTHGQRIPVRQNRRSALIGAALAPARERFTAQSYLKLCASLALIFGVESMIVFRDVLGIDDERKARQIKSWSIAALVEAALKESAYRR